MRLLYRVAGLAAAGAALVGFPSLASARPFRVNDIPNGPRFSCLNCHDDLQGKTINSFGSNARAALPQTGQVQEAHVDWAMLCGDGTRDSDHDGDSDAVELGDPTCSWRPGSADPSGTVSNPGKGDALANCGNGFLDPGEDCEGDQLTYPTCIYLGAGAGKLKCTEFCTYEYSDCSLPPGYVPPEDDGGGDEGCAANRGAIPGGPAGGGPGAGAAVVVAGLLIAFARGGGRRLRAKRPAA